MIFEILSWFLGIFTSPVNVLILLVVFIVANGLLNLRPPSGFPPGPLGYPYIGHVLDLANEPHIRWTQYAKKYGDVITIKIGTLNCVVLNSIEVINEALVKKQNDFAGRTSQYSTDLLSENGEDIVFGDFTPKWKFLRKVGHQAIRNYASGEKLEDLVRHEAFPRLQKAVADKNGESFYPKPLLYFTVANIIATMCFGQKYEVNDPELKEILKMIDDTNESFGNGLLADYISIFQYIPTKGIREAKRFMTNWLGLIQGKVTAHKNKFNKDNPEVHDLIDNLLKIQNDAKIAGEDQADKLTDINLRQTVSDIFGAGLDTTTNTFDWCIAFLACYPDVQTKVQNEIDDVIGLDRLPLLSDKGKLPYCDAVIHEVMRIRTVVPFAAPHKTCCDTSVGGYNLPKDTMVFLNLWNVHMNDKHWENPDEFRPERFLDADGKALPKPESFLPFSAGRRVCMGEVLAKSEMFLVFICLFQNYTFKVAPGKEKPNLSPSLENLIVRCRPYNVIAHPRKETD
uniref:Steroid 17-alpha-hydroxylase/17,20 lyase-like n=1 Tax=Saccoglossus kowalevskii TaxID=10224 RepID=A0ABM0MK67_SACKO|nr:PREDICTED: steroid 17-alpha-hydroxylase/17,20 lyase-like [Saccoglossus kowalevskii]